MGPHAQEQKKITGLPQILILTHTSVVPRPRPKIGAGPGDEHTSESIHQMKGKGSKHGISVIISIQ